MVVPLELDLSLRIGLQGELIQGIEVLNLSSGSDPQDFACKRSRLTRRDACVAKPRVRPTEGRYTPSREYQA